MLDLLVKYARDHELVVEPGFAPKAVRFALQFDSSGRYLGPISYQKPRSFQRAPEMSFSDLKALKGHGAHFLIETVQVVALLPVSNATEADLEKSRGKHRSFVSMLTQAATATPQLLPLAAALENAETLAAIRAGLIENKARPTDKVTFVVDGDFVVDSTSWHEWWRQFTKSIRGVEDDSNDSTQRMVCFATGAATSPASTHPKIGGLSDVGGMGVGSPLIGFDKDAFLSYGLQQSANSAVSDMAASAYRAALNHLIEYNGVRLATTKVVYWYSHTTFLGDDPLQGLFDGDEFDAAEEAGASIQADRELRRLSTTEAGQLGDRRYYSLTLSGAAGRVMVRDWATGQFDDLQKNVDQWFADLAIVARDGSGLARRPKLLAVLGAIVRDLNEIPAPHVAEMWKVATKTLPFAQQTMAMSLYRVKADIVSNSGFNHARMGLLRAYHVRARQGDRDLKPFINPDHPSIAYQCGRLMAIFAALQRAALPDVGAGVVQRFYAAASTTPALVLARLARTSQFHLGKIQNPGLAYWHESRIADVMGKIEGHIPKTLTLEQQSLFALGYYQQIAYDRSPRLAAVDADKTNSLESEEPQSE